MSHSACKAKAARLSRAATEFKSIGLNGHPIKLDMFDAGLCAVLLHIVVALMQADADCGPDRFAYHTPNGITASSKETESTAGESGP